MTYSMRVVVIEKRIERSKRVREKLSFKYALEIGFMRVQRDSGVEVSVAIYLWTWSQFK